ncbi:MAG: hypothetical protein R3C24_15550 [Cyanobacteriota/Melainabacteria group bacterium]
MPQGSPFEFEPPQEKNSPSLGRARYGDDVLRTVPFAQDDPNKKPTHDPYRTTPDNGQANGTDRGRGNNQDTATPGLFPTQTFTEQHRDKLGPGGIIDQHNNTVLDQQLKSITDTIDGRNRVKGNDGWIQTTAMAGGSTAALALTQLKIVDPAMEKLATSESTPFKSAIENYNRSYNHRTAITPGQWFDRAYGKTDALTAIDEGLDAAALRTERILAEQQEIAANLEREAGMKAAGREIKNPEARTLMSEADQMRLARVQQKLSEARGINSADRVAQLGDDVLSHSGLNLSGKTWSTTSGAAKLDGDEVIKLLDDKAGELGSLSKQSQKFTVADDVAGGMKSAKSRIAMAALAAGTLTIGDDTFRKGINTIAGTEIPVTNVQDKTGISGIAIPAVLLTHQPGSKWGTGLKLAGAMTASAMIDTAMKDSAITKAIPEPFKRTTWEDGVAMGAALYTIPRMKGDWRVKTAAFAGAYLLGNGMDALWGDSARSDIDVPTTAALKVMDQLDKSRSFDNLKLAVHSWNKVGERSIGAEGVVWAKFQERNAYTPSASGQTERDARWNSLSGAEKFQNRMEMAVLARSLGELRFQGGKRIGQENAEGTYVLKDNKIDLGGYALEKLLVSSVESGEAAKLALDSRINGQQLPNGTRVNSAVDAPAMRQFQQDTNIKIRQITDTPHDMDTLLKDLQHLHLKELGYDVYRKEVLNDTVNRIGQFQGMAGQTNEGRLLVAKLLRDEAIIRMAMAKNSLENGNGIEAGTTLFGTDQGEREPFPNAMKDSSGRVMQKGYDGVYGALDIARALDPDNADLRKLYDMAAKMANEVPAAVKEQMGSRVKNMLNVDNGLYRR